MAEREAWAHRLEIVVGIDSGRVAELLAAADALYREHPTMTIEEARSRVERDELRRLNADPPAGLFSSWN